MGPCVSLQIECVIEALSAKGAEIPLDIAVALHVSVQKPLQLELLGAESALEFGRVGLRSEGRKLLGANDLGGIGGKWVLDAVSAVDELHGRVWAKAELEGEAKLVNKIVKRDC